MGEFGEGSGALVSFDRKSSRQGLDSSRFKFLVIHGTDATFKSYLKGKPHDKDDMPLLNGQAFFPNREDWEEYTEKNGMIKQVGRYFRLRG